MGPPARLIAFMLAAAAHTACGSTLVANKSTDDFEGGSGPALHEAANMSSEGGGGVAGTRTITVLLTRHAFSCANAAQEFPYLPGFSIAHVGIQDPLLTECGEYRSRRLREPIRQQMKTRSLHPVTHVLASHLTRAMQTAGAMYGGKDTTVFAVPYISEKGRGLNNSRWVLEKEGYEKLVDANVDLSYLEKRTETKPSWEDFQTFLKDEFLPGLKFHETEEKGATIAVVSHSGFIKHLDVFEDCKKQKGYENKPKNNQIFVLQFKYKYNAEEQTTNLTLKTKGCDPLFPLDSELIQGTPKALCADKSTGLDDVGCKRDIQYMPLDKKHPGDGQGCCTFYNPSTAAPDEVDPAKSKTLEEQAVAKNEWRLRFPSYLEKNVLEKKKKNVLERKNDTRYLEKDVEQNVRGTSKSNRHARKKTNKNNKITVQSVRNRIRRMLLRKVLRAIRKQAH